MALIFSMLLSGWALPLNGFDAPWDGPDLDAAAADAVFDLANATADDKIYRLLNDAQVDDLAGELPARSHLLGVMAPASEIARSYAILAQGSEAPIAAAVEHWQDVSGLSEDPALLAWNLEHAKTLPLELQQAFAVLLYAVADATWLQSQATSELSNEEIQFLLDVLHEFDPAAAPDNETAPRMAEAYERMLGIADGVDFGAITEAGRIMVAAVSQTSRTLERVTQEIALAEEAAAPFTDGLDGFYQGLTPDRLEAMDSGQKLTVIIDYVRMVAEASGHAVAEPVPRSVRDVSLAEGLAEYVHAMGVASQSVLGPKEVLDAEMLPDRLQGALAHLLTAHASMARASNVLQDGALDPQMATAMYLEAVVGLVAAIRDAYPTLAIYGDLYQFAGPQYSKQLADQPGVVRDVTRTAQSMADSTTPLHGVVASVGHLNGIPLALPAETYDLSAGSLGRAVLDLYDQVGVPYDDKLASQIENGAAQLPTDIEQASSRVLQAQIVAWRMLEEEWGSWTPEQRHWLFEDASEPQQALANPVWDHRDAVVLGQYFDAIDANRRTTLTAAMIVAQALQDSRQQLDGLLTAPPMSASASSAGPSGGPDDDGSSDEPSGGDGSPSVPMSGPGMSSQSSSSAAPVPCTDIPVVSDCDNFDALFMDPVLRWVMITGPGSTDYDPDRIQPFGTGRDQMLTIDLGGDDHYRNGQASAGALVNLQTVALMPAAVSLDMDGNDEYMPPPPGHGPNHVQGVALIGLAFLVDQRGDDTYQAGPGSVDGLAQGAAASGLGMLIDESGNDVYLSQLGKSQGWGGSTLLGGGDGGIGVLLEREEGGALGADSYRSVSGTRHAQGMARASSAGILIDAIGDDEYRNGGQGRVIAQGNSLNRNPIGLAVLADFGGRDSYTRQTPASGEPVKDGQCFTGLAASIGEENVVVPEVAEDAQGNPTVTWDHGIVKSDELVSVFADLEEGACSVSSPVTVGGDSEIGPGDLQDFIEGLLSSVNPEDIISDPLALLGDADGDQWPDSAEELAGTNANDADQYPVGLPDAAGSGVEPSGSPFLVEVASWFAVGDVSSTTYDREFLLSLDLGGPDSYTNHVGSALPKGLLTDAPTFFTNPNTLDDGMIPTTHIDLGPQGDDYDGPDGSQGSGGILIDFAGDDEYVAGAQSQGTGPMAAMNFGAAQRLGFGLLADLAGDDQYVAGPKSQGFANHISSSQDMHWGVFMDFLGNDEYNSPSQGQLRRGPTSLPGTFHAGFHDLAGDDVYVTEDQGRLAGTFGPPRGTGFGAVAGYWAHFGDLEGDDVYVSRATGADRSALLNHRQDTHARTAGHANPAAEISLATRIDMDSTRTIRDAGSQDPANGEDFEVLLPSMAVAIGKRDDTVYREPMVLTIDLGGEDTYLNNAGGSLLFAPASLDPSTDAGLTGVTADSRSHFGDPRSLAALLIDTEGADTYDDSEWLRPDSESFHYANQGRLPSYGSLPLPPLPPAVPDLPLVGSANPDAPRPLPASPRDFVRAVSQGSGFLGVGMLVDEDGDDSYSAFRFAQGTGVVGIGLLWDRVGDDSYAYNPAAVSSPVASDRVVVWADMRLGRWNLYRADRSIPGTVAVPGELLTDFARAGARGDHREPTIDAARIVWSANFGEGWDLYWIDGDEPPRNLFEHFFAGRQTLVSGNQTNPILRGNDLAYLDDAAGQNHVYLQRKLDLLSPPEPVRVSTGDALAKRHLDFGGERIAWSQWNQSTNRWDIVVHDMITKTNTVISPQAATGDRFQPRLAGERPGGYVAWTEQNPAGDWDIRGYDFQLDSVFSIADGPGNQREHDANEHGVVYVDEADDPSSLRFWFRVGDKTCIASSPSAGASMPAFDTSRVFDAYFVRIPEADERGIQPHDVVMRPMSNCQQRFQVSDSETNAQPRFHQGAGLQQGLGVLLEEGGQDAYTGWDFSQGSAFTTANTPSDPFRQEPADNQGAPTELGARGILADFDGHDKYKARDYGQGSHGSGIFYQQTPGPGQPLPSGAAGAVALADHQGILVDVRGNDFYSARGASQGFAGLGFGGSVICVLCDDGGWLPLVSGQAGPIISSAVTAVLANSVGILTDTGGIDQYAYRNVELLLPSVAADFDRTCADTVPETPPEGPVPPMSFCIEPVAPLIDGVFSQVAAAVQSLDESSAQVVEPDPITRNDQVWRQSSYGQGPVPVQATRPGPAIHPGGLGIDLGAYDKYAEAAQDVLRQIVVVDLNVEHLAPSPGSGAYQETIRLSVDSTDPQGQPHEDDFVRIESVEYFAQDADAGNRFLGFGNDPDCGYCLAWSTNNQAWPDGEYSLTARASLAPATSGTSVGYVEADPVEITLNNRPRLHDLTLNPTAFSPQPFPEPASADPTSTDIQFTVSRDVDETVGRITIDILGPGGSLIDTLEVVDLVNPDADPLVTYSTNWDGHVGNNAVPPGQYTIRVAARDDPDDSARETTAASSVFVDGDQPDATCVYVAGAPCGGQAFLSRHDVFPKLIGDSVVGTVSVQWSPGSNKPVEFVRTYHLFACFSNALPCPTASWQHVQLPGAGGLANNFDVAHGQWLSVTVLAEDIFGNLEYGVRPDGTFRTDVSEAFEAKRAAGDVLRVQVDLVAPELDMFALVDGEQLPPTSPILVSRQSSGHLVGAIDEPTTTPVTASLFLFNADQESLELPLGTPTPGPDDPSILFVESAPWKDHIPASWLGGTIPYLFQVMDFAGNVNEIAGVLFLDPDKPEILETVVIYPDGKTSVEADDTFQVVVRPVDPCRPICSPVQSLAVSMDASVVNATLEDASFRFKPPKHYTLEIHAESIPTDPTVEAFPFAVADLAGNVNASTVDVRLGDPQLGIELASVGAEHDSLTINWTTQVATHGHIEYGTTTALGSRIDDVAPEPATDHEIQLSGLNGATKYFFRIVAEDHQGLIERGPLESGETLTGLDLILLEPIETNLAVSDTFMVTFEGRLLSDDSAALDFQVAIRPESSPNALVVGSFVDASQGTHSVTIDPADFADGLYFVQVSVAHDGESLIVETAPIAMDRRAPRIVPIQPVPGAVVTDTHPGVRVRILDALSGVDSSSVGLTVNGQSVDAAEVVVSGDLFDLPDVALQPGSNRFVLTVSDGAGNVGVRQWDVTLDVAPPDVESAALVLPDEKGAVRLGDEVLIEVRATDPSGVKRVWADVSNVSSVKQLYLDRAAANRYSEAFFVEKLPGDTPATGANETIPVWVEDSNGYRTRVPVELQLTVDGVAPHVVRHVVRTPSVSRVEVDLELSEPATVVVTASDAVVQGHSGLTRPNTTQSMVLHVAGDPTAEIDVELRLQDSAGNVVDEAISVLTLVAHDETAPTVPTNLTLTAPGEGRVNLAWSSSMDDVRVAGYRVWRHLAADSGFEFVAEVRQPSYRDMPPSAPGVSYYVSAFDFAGHESLPSNVAAVVPRFSIELHSVGVSPSVGTPQTDFVFHATYADPAGSEPAAVVLVLDDTPYGMDRVDEGPDCMVGCRYQTTLRLPSVTARDGPVRYHVEVYRGLETVRSPSGPEDLRGPVVLAGAEDGSVGNETAPGPGAGLGAQVPGPGVAAIFAAIAATLCVHRGAWRRKP